MRCVSGESNLRPIKRFTAYTVFDAFVTACRFAICPTRRSPFSVKPTTLGVVRPPSLFGTICTVPPSSTATQQLVVPKSMPIAFPIYLRSWASNRDLPELTFGLQLSPGRDESVYRRGGSRQESPVSPCRAHTHR